MVAILPKCLLEAPITIINKETLYKGLVLELDNEIPIISNKELCVQNATDVPAKQEDIDKGIG